METIADSDVLTAASNETQQIGTNITTEDQPGNSSNYDNVVQIAMIFLLVFAVLAIIVNLLVLVASKFTTAGRHSILVFIRSLCVADTLIGVYGITKYIFVSEKPQWINCFLPDALLICAFVAENLTFVALLSDCCNILYRYLLERARVRYSKYNSIFLMIYMWNSAFIFAFLPQMGWNNTPYTCAFFEYHSVYYLVILSIIFFISVLLMAVYSYRCRSFLRQLHTNPDTPPHIQLEVKKIKVVVLTSHMDIGAHIVSFLPLIIYILLHCNTCVNASAKYSDSFLLVLLPVIVLKSIISGVIRGRRTRQIYQVIWKKWMFVRSSICYGFKGDSNDGGNNAVMLPEISMSQSSSTSLEPSRVPKMSNYRQYLLRQRRAHSVASIGNGLLNVAALATATPLTRKQRFLCSKCGHVNSIQVPPREAAPSHPSQAVYSGKKWNNNYSKTPTRPIAAPPYTRKEEQYLYTTQEQDIPTKPRNRVKLKQLKRNMSDSFHSSFSTEESTFSDNLPKTKRRAQSVDSGVGPSIVGGVGGGGSSTQHKDSINNKELVKASGVQQQQKVVTFNDAILGDNDVFVSREESDLGLMSSMGVTASTAHSPSSSSITEHCGAVRSGSLVQNNSMIIEMERRDYIGRDNEAFVEDFHDPECAIHGHVDRSDSINNREPDRLELRL